MIENVEITGTELGIEDHGFFSFTIFVSGNGWGTGFGGIVLDGWDKAILLIRAILEVVGVNNWEDLPGKYIRMEAPELSERVYKIGNLIEDKWFDLRDWTNK